MKLNNILLNIAEGVATVTLNRPERLNAFTGEMHAELREALARIKTDASVRALLITGAGRGFCAGQDLSERMMSPATARADVGDSLEKNYNPLLKTLRALPMPVICAVNGVAAGAGCNLALACDVRLASSEARFGETFVRIGLSPDWGGTFHLPRLAGTAAALDLCWTGDLVGADDALRLGLVQRVYPAAEFDARWREYAAALAAAPATSVRAAKRALRSSFVRTLEQCLDAESSAQAACWASADSAEGLAAFVEKRAPRFGTEPLAEESQAPSAAARRFE